MSFVSIIARENFITVMSDGQVTGENGKTLQKDYKKFKKISRQQIIAFAGAKSICEQIVEQVPYTKGVYNLSDIAQQIWSVIKEERFNAFNLFFGIAGVDVDDKVSLFLVNNKTGLSSTRPNANSDVSYITLNPSEIVNVSERISIILSETGFNTPTKCLKAQKKLNDFIADNDPQVNKYTFDLTIKV